MPLQRQSQPLPQCSRLYVLVSTDLSNQNGLGLLPAGEEDPMTEKKKDEELTPEELEEQNGEQLPDREAMSLISPPTGADGIATIAPDEPPALG